VTGRDVNLNSGRWSQPPGCWCKRFLPKLLIRLRTS